jgi:hypothetical protein
MKKDQRICKMPERMMVAQIRYDRGFEYLPRATRKQLRRAGRGKAYHDFGTIELIRLGAMV